MKSFPREMLFLIAFHVFYSCAPLKTTAQDVDQNNDPVAVISEPLVVTAISAQWDDNLGEWEVQLNDEDISGFLQQRWQRTDDWSSWDYRLGEIFGSIQTIRKGDPNHWTLRGMGETVEIQSVFRNDITRWRITNHNITLKLEIDRRSVPFAWYVDDPKYGWVNITSQFDNDPRDWIIEDRLSPEVSIHMKMAIYFSVVLGSTLQF